MNLQYLRQWSFDDITIPSKKHWKSYLFILNMDIAAQLKSLVVKEVPAGTTAVLNCDSNDFDHNFMFWLFDKNQVIGPGNEYDERKYKYEVLSGKLHIDVSIIWDNIFQLLIIDFLLKSSYWINNYVFIQNVSPQESGYYKCISKKLDGTGLLVGEVEMLVKGTGFTAADAVKLVAIIVSIIVIVGCAVLYFRLRKEWRRYDGRVIIPGNH